MHIIPQSFLHKSLYYFFLYQIGPNPAPNFRIHPARTCLDTPSFFPHPSIIRPTLSFQSSSSRSWWMNDLFLLRQHHHHHHRRNNRLHACISSSPILRHRTMQINTSRKISSAMTHAILRSILVTKTKSNPPSRTSPSSSKSSLWWFYIPLIKLWHPAGRM